MTPEISKPEWFQMAEADAIAPKSKRKRGLRVMALATPLLVLGAGLVYAQTQDGPNATASTGSVIASTVAADTPSSSSTAASVASSPTAEIAAVPVAQVSNSTPTKPGIKMPTGGGNDD